MNGTDLLARFKENRSEAAFAELVRHYTNLVYSIAKRRVANDLLAQEVTQVVFIRLANAAPKIRGDAELVAWLHRTTVHASIDLWRSEVRRRAREEQAVAMQFEQNETAPWNEMAPVLDEALNELNDADRQAILLRFFDEKTMRDLGVAFGVSEDAAKMRVSRALDRLRNHLSSRGVACSAVALAAVLTERSVEAAPSQLVTRLASLKVPVSAGIGTAAGIFGLLLQTSKVKIAAGAVAVAIIGVATLAFLRSRGDTDRIEGVNPSQSNATTPAAQAAQASSSTTGDAGNSAEETTQPDPLKLLQGVARARQRITSGTIEFQVSSHNLVRDHRETNDLRVTAVFDDGKLRFEQVSHEYAYVLRGDGATEFSDQKIKELNLDREGAERAGLLKGFKARYVTAYDGATVMRYRESDGRPEGTSIEEPRGSWTYLFDPRCLGLRTSPGPESTVENCLGYNGAKSVNLAGKDLVEGFPAWHVQVKSKFDDLFDFWVDVANPERLLKHAYGRDEVVSKYSASTRANPLPTEVTVSHRNGPSPWWGHRFVVANAQINVPVDPISWTLAGLGMPVGTDVIDERNKQWIGHWTGTGLSGNLPDKKAPPQPAPDRTELLSVLENYPSSSEAFDDARWIILNTPDNDDVEKAVDVILREHIQNTNLVHLAVELERVRPRSTRKLLDAMIEKNPSPDVRVAACVTLATMLKDEADYGRNKKATEEAKKLFERIINEFGQSGKNGAEAARFAKPELSELRRLLIGMPAPEIEGVDMEGQKMKLSDYRGKVVVLHFWSGSYDDAEGHHKLVDRMLGKPFALIGINCDRDVARAKATIEKHKITWPSFRDGRDGPISKDWNCDSWPTIYVLDREGIIRYRDAREGSLGKAVDSLMGE